MSFHVIDLRRAAQLLEKPFSLLALTEADEYTCYLYRCEGAMPLHRHPGHDELFLPLDGLIELVEVEGRQVIKAGQVALAPRGCKHGSASASPAHVLLINRGERGLSLNGHHSPTAPLPLQVAEPVASLDEVGDNKAVPLLRCDTLQLYAERIAGSGASRRATRDLLVLPLKGTIGLRCGGIVVILSEWELARVPAGTGWHLFGKAVVVWMTVGEAG